MPMQPPPDPMQSWRSLCAEVTETTTKNRHATKKNPQHIEPWLQHSGVICYKASMQAVIASEEVCVYIPNGVPPARSVPRAPPNTPLPPPQGGPLQDIVCAWSCCLESCCHDD